MSVQPALVLAGHGGEDLDVGVEVLEEALPRGLVEGGRRDQLAGRVVAGREAARVLGRHQGCEATARGAHLEARMIGACSISSAAAWTVGGSASYSAAVRCAAEVRREEAALSVVQAPPIRRLTAQLLGRDQGGAHLAAAFLAARCRRLASRALRRLASWAVSAAGAGFPPLIAASEDKVQPAAPAPPSTDTTPKLLVPNVPTVKTVYVA